MAPHPSICASVPQLPRANRALPSQAQPASPAHAAFVSPPFRGRTSAREAQIVALAAKLLQPVRSLTEPVAGRAQLPPEPHYSLNIDAARKLVEAAFDSYELERIVKWLMAPGWMVSVDERSAQELAARLLEMEYHDALAWLASPLGTVGQLGLSPVSSAFYCLDPHLKKSPAFQKPLAPDKCWPVVCATLPKPDFASPRSVAHVWPFGGFRLLCSLGYTPLEGAGGYSTDGAQQVQLQMLNRQGGDDLALPLLTFAANATGRHQQYFGTTSKGAFWVSIFVQLSSPADVLMAEPFRRTVAWFRPLETPEDPWLPDVRLDVVQARPLAKRFAEKNAG